MRRFAFTLAFCLCLSVSAFGQGTDASAAQPEPPRVEIIEDQEAGSVRVLIGGREVLTIDASGLHVNGDINYTGTSTDYGPEGFAARNINAGAPHAP